MKTVTLFAFAAALALVTATTLPAQTGPVNLNFKEGQIGELPKGWSFSPPDKGFSAKLTDQCAKPDSRCAQLRYEGQGAPATFGNLMQSFDAAPYRNKLVRFRASVRVEAGGRAQLWFRVDLANKRMGFFDNMGARPILSSAWRPYEIVGDIDEDAEKINIGMMLSNGGAAFLADVSVEVAGSVQTAPAAPVEASRPLSGRGLENLTAYARLFGYIRHFHPSDAAARAGWDAVAIAGIRAVEGAKDAAELAQKLENFFRPVAPTVRVFPASQAPPKLNLDPPAGKQDLKVISWRHRGFGTGSAQSTYRSERVTSVLAGAKLPAPLLADLGGGVRALVPMALFIDDKGTLPHGAPGSAGVPARMVDNAKADEDVRAPRPGTTKIRYTGDDRATRLADVVIAWNVFQHFYPYFEVVKTDWPKALTAALQSAAADKDAAEFTFTLRRLVAALQDGHGRVNRPGGTMQGPIPVEWDWVEGRLVITDVAEAQGQSIERGDAVIAINGKPVAQAIREAEALISAATPQWRLFRTLGDIGMGPINEPLTLELESFREPAKRYTVTLERKSPGPPVREPRPEKVAELKPGIFYIDLTRLNDGEWKDAVPKLEKASRLIFDMRGYPRLRPDFLRHLSETPMTSAQWHVPIVTAPDHKDMKFERGGEWDLAPAKPYLKARRVFLTDGRAISYAESCMGIVEHYRLGEIVGGPTAGTNGNVNPFLLPGHYRVSWTGMKVLKHDGSQHHGVGIIPTVPASRTGAGITAGKDEVLERALELLK